MPYSEKSHSKLVGSLLASASYDPHSNQLAWQDCYCDRANSGIGYECARALAGMGARVVLACRSEEKGEQARRRIVASTGNGAVEVEVLDCGELKSVHEFLGRWAKRDLKRVDILINNAGGLTSTVAVTPDGFEQTYQVNHLAHVLLTITLLNRGYMSPDARIVSVSSVGFYSSVPLDGSNADGSDVLAKYESKVGTKLSFGDMMEFYFRSKAAQAIWTMALQRHLSRTDRWKDITVHSCHPGTVKSSIWTQPAGAGSMAGRASDMFKSIALKVGINNEQGAIVPVWLATAPQPATLKLRGLYWDRLTWKWVRPWSMEAKRQDELWNKWCNDAQVHLLS